MAKTSATHPLQIGELGLRNGRLGLTFCPGKQQPGALSGAWAHDLTALVCGADVRLRSYPPN